MKCDPNDNSNEQPAFTGAQDREVPDGQADEALAALAKAISHPTRVRILRMLAEARVCSAIVDQFPLAQSTVSEHLRLMKEAGLINSRVERGRAKYCVNRAVLQRLKALVKGL
jgi:ArsR family transcriptional regulator